MNDTVRIPAGLKALILDLDGTLIDSAPDVAANVNRVLQEEGRPPLSLQAVKDLVGQGARVLLELAFRQTGGALPAERHEACVQRFLGYYSAAPIANTTLYPGVIDVLEHFQRQGIPMAICTNKPERTTTPVIGPLGLTRFFKIVSCGDKVPFRKPDGRHVLHILTALGVGPESAAMVGDSENDAGAAHEAKVPFVAVSYGYCHVPLQQLRAAAVIGDFRELPKALMALSRAPVRG